MEYKTKGFQMHSPSVQIPQFDLSLQRTPTQLRTVGSARLKILVTFEQDGDAFNYCWTSFNTRQTPHTGFL